MPQKINTPLTELLNIDFPIIVAPMFLVSNVKMVQEAIKNGVTAAIPALNYRTDEEFRAALKEIRDTVGGPFGINLIVNKSNVYFKRQLKSCCDYGVDFIVTSLGSPEETIKEAHKNGMKVFCDVVNLEYAKKVVDLGCDALVGVNAEAGGHRGDISGTQLISMLNTLGVPVISAGGVGDGKGIKKMLDAGAAGLQIGSPFIACNEAPVSQEYKQACVDYGKNDIVDTTKISGSRCTVINTPYVQKVGTDQNWLEARLSKNKTLKKYVKMLTMYKGMKAVEKAAFSATYKTMWCAGPSIEYTKKIEPLGNIINRMKVEYFEEVAVLKK